MARMNPQEREVFLKEQQKERERERKQREPTVGGSIKAGAKKVVEALTPGAAKPATNGRNGNGKGNGKGNGQPTEGMGGYGGAGDARRKAYIEKQTD